MILSPTFLETHPTGTFNKNAIVSGNWTIINNIFDPTHVGAQAGVLQAALAGLTVITYGTSITVDLNAGRSLQMVTLTGNLTIAASNKAAGRARRLVIVGDGTDRALTWPVGAVWAGPAVTSVPSGKTVVVDIAATSTTDASLVLTSVSRFDFVTTADLTTTLSGYVTSAALTTALGSYASLTGTETLTNKTITGGRFNQINDTNGAASIILTATASAVNQLTAVNAATGTGVALNATGSDTNISFTLSGKGTGAVILPKAEITAAKIALHSTAYVQLTTSRALTDDDNGKVLYSSSGSDITVTAPDSLTKPFSCTLKQEAAGAIILAVSGTAVLRNIDTHTKTGGQWSAASIDYRTGNDVVLYGRTAA